MFVTSYPSYRMKVTTANLQQELCPPPEIVGLALSETPTVDHYCGNERFLSKALKLFPDPQTVDITVDFEDGAPVGSELERARALLKVAADASRPVGVRVHPLDSKFWIEEIHLLFATTAPRLTHITIPKVQEPAQLRAALGLISDCRHAAPAALLSNWRGVRILIESPRAISNIDNLARLPGLSGLDFGIMDFVSCFDGAVPQSAMQSPDQFTHPLVLDAKQRIAVTAKSYGLSAAHNVTIAAADGRQTERDAEHARSIGFTRMWSIHPTQTEAILRAFQPSSAECSLAKLVLEKARSNSWGPVEHGGLLYDRASYRYLWSVLSKVTSS